jgi:hypothetical protein
MLVKYTVPGICVDLYLKYIKFYVSNTTISFSVDAQKT